MADVIKNIICINNIQLIRVIEFLPGYCLRNKIILTSCSRVQQGDITGYFSTPQRLNNLSILQILIEACPGIR